MKGMILLYAVAYFAVRTMWPIAGDSTKGYGKGVLLVYLSSPWFWAPIAVLTVAALAVRLVQT
jgi:hypothetical protein